MTNFGFHNSMMELYWHPEYWRTI